MFQEADRFLSKKKEEVSNEGKGHRLFMKGNPDWVLYRTP
jgi:hypothetical protein